MKVVIGRSPRPTRPMERALARTNLANTSELEVVVVDFGRGWRKNFRGAKSDRQEPDKIYFEVLKFGEDY